MHIYLGHVLYIIITEIHNLTWGIDNHVKSKEVFLTILLFWQLLNVWYQNYLKLKFLQYKVTKSWNPLSTCFKKGVLHITYNTYPFCNANNSLKVRWHRWFTNKVSPFLFLSWHLPCLLAQCSDPMGNSGASSKKETIRRKQFSCQIFIETKQSLREKKGSYSFKM